MSGQTVNLQMEIDNRNMNFENNRLFTFSNWPSSAPVDHISIVKAGFFYTGQGTEVQCFSCGVKISQWNYGDQVMWRHRQLDPNCTFVVNPGLSGNVPLVMGPDCSPRNADSTSSVLNNSEQSMSNPEDFSQPGEDEMYKSHALRLLSFVYWSDPSVSRQALANAGFYHIGGGRLRCAWCSGELAPFQNFGSIGAPLDVHREYFPSCTFAASMASRHTDTWSTPSLPLGQVSNFFTSPLVSPITESIDEQPQSSGAAYNSRLLSGAGGTWRSLGVVGSGARHPTQASLASRLATYSSWHHAGPSPTPEALADAGFYYAGVDDQVRCFYCDGGLGKWESSDEPWSEHAHWFPHCGYVILVKGQEFVDKCREKNGQGRTSTNDNPSAPMRRVPPNLEVTESMIQAEMEGPAATAALGAGLDAARVRRAIVRRLRHSRIPFSSSEGLIDAVLNEQLNEEAWSITPIRSPMIQYCLSRLRPHSDESTDDRLTLAESPTSSPTSTPIRHLPTINNLNHIDRTLDRVTVRTFDQINSPISETNSPIIEFPNLQASPSFRRPDPSVGMFDQPAEVVHQYGRIVEQPISITDQSLEMTDQSLGIICQAERTVTDNSADFKVEDNSNCNMEDQNVCEKKDLTLEEENRQLKEARMCKVCMDSEVSVVFLPCGHLVSCAKCGAALSACPLCRASVKALVRAYLA